MSCTIVGNSQTVESYQMQKSKLSNCKTFKDSLVAVAKLFIGVPFKAKTLEESPELLVVNLTGMDCITFVEYAIAITRSEDTSAFRNKLTSLRYRDGLIGGYSSRIHYLSEWLVRTSRKGIFTNVGVNGNRCFEPELTFMSNHASSYNALKNDTLELYNIRSKESDFNKLKLGFNYYDREHFKNEYLQNGDIVAFKSKVNGLDFDHLGFVVYDRGKMKLLHASLDNKVVMLTNESVKEYFNRIKKFDGIVIVR